MIENWHIPIMGFTQTRGKWNGFDSLYDKMCRKVNGDKKTKVLIPLRWRANFDSLADFIFRHSSQNPAIKVYAYSWGCGHGAIKLCKEFRKRGLVVEHMVLCDPVYHHWLRPIRALLFSPNIKIPDNVVDVSWLRQRQNKPQATGLCASKFTTKINSPVEVKKNHAFMDDSTEFHELVLSVMEKQ